MTASRHLFLLKNLSLNNISFSEYNTIGGQI